MTASPSSRKKGFTLTEVMVALAAGTIIMILILASFSPLSTSLTTTETVRTLHNDVRHAMDVMTRDIARGSAVTQCIATNTLAVNAPQTGSSSNIVSIVYSLSGDTLSRKEGSDPSETLASGISAITFTLYDTAGGLTVDPSAAFFVEVDIQAQARAVLNTHTDRFRTRTRLRRKGL
jgi:prepilin-type N-terminal cleavage/methylation domain-containing protein